MVNVCEEERFMVWVRLPFMSLPPRNWANRATNMEIHKS